VNRSANLDNHHPGVDEFSSIHIHAVEHGWRHATLRAVHLHEDRYVVYCAGQKLVNLTCCFTAFKNNLGLVAVNSDCSGMVGWQ
jgi:hypothetical protein